MADRVYTKEEVDAILSRALERQHRGDATTHDELLAAAREVGLSREAIESAAGEVLSRRREDDEVKALRMRGWRGFLAHLVPYVLVSALLVFLNVETTSFPWAVIPILAWGVGLASHLLAVALPDEAKLRRRVQREHERAHGRTASGRRVASEEARLRLAPSEQDEAVAEADAEADDREPLERRRA